MRHLVFAFNLCDIWFGKIVNRGRVWFPDAADYLLIYVETVKVVCISIDRFYRYCGT